MSGYYQGATICKNGHVISASRADATPFCDKCGEKTVSACSNCKNTIRGTYVTPGIAVLGGRYKKPSYCYNCGEPYPWTSQIINSAIELLALDEDLSNEHKEIIKLALPDLLVEKPTTTLAVAKYKKYSASTQSFIKDGLKNILIDVVSESVKKSIWG